MIAEAVGEIEKDDGVLVVKRIFITMHLKAEESQKATIERVFGMFADRCPVYKTLKPAIDMQLSLRLEFPDA